MKKWHFAGAIAVVAGIPALSAGCDPAPLGELILIVKTDMAPPKDFNKMQIQVFNEGSLKFKYEGPVPGDPGTKERIVLPSTLGLVAPDDPTNAIRIEVGVRSGGKDGPVRVVREVVTTIPADRVAMLDVPIQFLCKKDDIPFDNNGDLKPSDCPDGKTCIAGTCEDSTVDSSTLPDYDPKSVYGGSGDPTKGECFDVAKCFEAAELIDGSSLDTGACIFPVPASIKSGELNLALGVESDGICNGLGCFVVLDAGSDTGWKLDESGANVVLPKGICDNLTSEKPSGQKVLQIVQAKTDALCPQKGVQYPTCGPWSAVESSEPPVPVPTAIAGAQDRPISVTILTTIDGDFAYWSSNGDSSIKGASINGGPLLTNASPEPPRDITVSDKALFFTAGTGSVFAFLANPKAGQDPVVQLQSGLNLPEGIALLEGKDPAPDKLFWTEFSAAGRVLAGTLSADASTITDVQELSTDSAYPARLVTDATYVYWTNEGTFDDKNGSIMRFPHANAGGTQFLMTVDPLAAPRAIAISPDTDELYFVTIADGKVWRIPNASQTPPGEPEEFMSGGAGSYPNGIAVDGKYVYVTFRGNGTVVYKAKDAEASVEPTSLAKGQKSPGSVRLSGDKLIWVNEGFANSDAQDGAIISFDKSGL